MNEDADGAGGTGRSDGGAPSAERGQRRRARRKPKPILFLRAEELARLLSALTEPRDRAVASVLAVQALRSNECRMLDVQDIRFSEQALMVRHGKGGKQRLLPLEDDVAEAITAYLAVRLEPRDGEPLFVSRPRGRLSNRQIRRDAKRWAALAGITSEFHPHTGRHTALTQLLDQGVPLPVVRDYAGHSNLSVTNIYAHVTPQRLRKEIDRARHG